MKDDIEKLKTPTMVNKLRSFLGLCNLFRRFVPNLASRTVPLNKNFKKAQLEKLDILNEEEATALKTLPENFVTPPVLELPKKERKLIVGTDAYIGQV